MNNKIIFVRVLLLIILCGNLNAQNQWILSNNGYCPSAFSFPSEDTNYFSTPNSVFRTTNKGQTWTPSNLAIPPYEMCFPDNNNGYASSNYSIAKTTNGGNSWTSVWGNILIGENKLYFLNPNTGWVYTIYGKIYRTTNGGAQWDTTIFEGEVPSLSFINESTGWGLSRYSMTALYIKKTTNSGINWITISNFEIPEYLTKIQFINENTGWVFNNNYIYKSINGGYNWSLIFQYSANPMNDFFFVNANTGFFSTYGGIYNTTNGGNNWLQLLYPYTLYGSYLPYLLYFRNDLVGWAAGCEGIFKTTNGGTNWNCIEPQLTAIGGNFSFINNQTGYTGFLKTTNAGSNWFIYSQENIYFRDHGIHSTCFLNENTGFLSTAELNYPIGYRQVIYKTTNGGTSFTKKLSGSVSWDNFSCLYFINDFTGWAAGTADVYKSTNTGENWSIASTIASGIVENIKFFNLNTGFASTSAGDILKSSDGGTNWSVMQTNPTIDFEALFMINENTGWVSGSGGNIYKTVNGWINWNQQQSNTNASLYSLYFVDANTGWACGENGIILKTVNSGITWKIDLNQFGTTLSTMKFLDNLTGFCAGANDVILRTTTGGITFISKLNEPIPNSFSLCQNYPNPFNPSTKIRYDLPRAGVVRLAVYDVMGREIEMLVNERQTAGSYEATFDGSGFASGVYFYRLTAEGYGETRKMLLIR
ncbi:MAG: YCF48-related protein [Ignavibacteriae bacterium]|nr:YCF48-related protein [Ignavibacteriota bacterium]